MRTKTKRAVLSWGGFLLGTVAVFWKGTIGKTAIAPYRDRESGNKHLGVGQFQRQDAVGVFKLGYVDCLPYSGPEQTISIEEGGEVQCVEPSSSVPGVTDGSNASHVGTRKRLGRLKAGTILKGELEPAPGFVSAAKAAGPISGVKMQVVNLPGHAPGVWLAVSAKNGSGGMVAWDEIYVRPGFAPNVGVRI